jgi:phosphoribosylcarboxyaminoimidazole (NCAIR) mutase
VRAYCKQYEDGKVKEGSKKWDVLVAAAGGADLIPGFCAALLADAGED